MPIVLSSGKRVRLVRPVNYVLLQRPDGWNGMYYTVNECETCGKKGEFLGKSKSYGCFECSLCVSCYEAEEEEEDDDRAKCEDCNTDIEDDPESVTIGNRYKFHQTHQVCIECADKQCHWCSGEEGVLDTLENGTQVCEECRPRAMKYFKEEEGEESEEDQ